MTNENPEIPPELLRQILELLGPGVRYGGGVHIVIVGGPCPQRAAARPKANFRQHTRGVRTYRVAARLDRSEQDCVVTFSDGSNTRVGKKDFTLFPASAMCALSTLRCVSEGGRPSDGAYMLQRIDAVLVSGGEAYAAAPDDETQGYRNWLLVRLRDGEETKLHLAGPDENGVPRVFELIVFRSGTERHTRPAIESERRNKKNFRVVIEGGYYHVER